MKKLQCIIVDDEPIARKILKEFVEKTPFLEIAGQFENARKAEAFLQNGKADVLFLDIEMPKVSGLEFLNRSNIKPLVILTTAFPEYALKGYDLDIIDYLLKPIAYTRFLKAAQKVKEYTELKGAAMQNPSLPYLFVRSEKRIEKVELKDILYIESMGNYVTIYTDAKRIIAYLTLKGMERQLPSDEFIKIHQSYLVGFSRISSIEGNQVKIKDKILPISRNYRESLMQIVERRLLKR